jgi:hypothetical protein
MHSPLGPLATAVFASHRQYAPDAESSRAARDAMASLMSSAGGASGSGGGGDTGPGDGGAGSGVGQQHVIDVQGGAPGVVDLGLSVIGAPRYVTLTLRNTGTLPLVIAGLQSAASHPAEASWSFTDGRHSGARTALSTTGTGASAAAAAAAIAAAVDPADIVRCARPRVGDTDPARIAVRGLDHPAVHAVQVDWDEHAHRAEDFDRNTVARGLRPDPRPLWRRITASSASARAVVDAHSRTGGAGGFRRAVKPPVPMQARAFPLVLRPEETLDVGLTITSSPGGEAGPAVITFTVLGEPLADVPHAVAREAHYMSSTVGGATGATGAGAGMATGDFFNDADADFEAKFEWRCSGFFFFFFFLFFFFVSIFSEQTCHFKNHFPPSPAPSMNG